MRPVTGARMIVAAAVAAAVFGASSTPARALSERLTSAQAIPGQMIRAPRSDALIMHLPVRVAIRVPGGTTHLWVRVGKRDLTSRFSRRGSARVAELTRHDGLQYGDNELSVLAQRRGHRPLAEARAFVLVRSQSGFVRARINAGPVTSLSLWMANPSSLSVIHRNRIVRAWLNGRTVTGALDTSEVTHITGSLSASHGLRHGNNSLRILVVEPAQGRYVLIRRRFRVSGRSLLPAAGLDVETPVRESVRLDGRPSRGDGAGRLRYRWKIISAPHGSNAKLRGPGSARPFLTPDRQGRYIVALTVSERRGRRSPSRIPPPRTDRVTVDGAPQSLLLPFQGLTTRAGKSGVQIGDTPQGFYPNLGGGMQWLTLDRSTLTPTGTGNTVFDGSAHGDHGIDGLNNALCDPEPGNGCGAGLNELVVFSYKPGSSSGPPVQPDQVDAFNNVLRRIGVGPIDAKVLTATDKKLVIVGVPSAGAGSGWYTDGGSASRDALAGWLMPDTAKQAGAFLYRLQPERPTFDTSTRSTATTNVMTIRDQRISATLPSPATGGFQVALIDPVDFTVVDNAVFGTNGVPEFGNGLQAMASFLNAHAGSGLDLAVQSIGTIGPGRRPSIGDNGHDLAIYPWYLIGAALSAYGANPHVFNTAQGSYAYLGGPALERAQDAQSSSAVVLDPTSKDASGKPHPTTEPGTLSGSATMRADGNFMPVAAAGPASSFDDSLKSIVFRPSTPWPYTAGGSFPQQKHCPAPGTDAAAYARALSFIAVNIGLGDYASDLRGAYIVRDSWSDPLTLLTELKHESGHGFSEAEFCNLKAELQQEFQWLDNVHGLFQHYVDVLRQSDGTALVQSIGRGIRKAVTENETGPEVGWSVGAFLGNLGSAVILGFFPEATPELAAWEAVVTFYELARELVSDLKGAPVGDQVKSKVQDLESDVANRLTASWDGLYRLRQVISSDYGRLHALGPVAADPEWLIDVPSTSKTMNAATGAFFYSQLMPIPYGVHAIFDSTGRPVYDQPTGLSTTLEKCHNIFGTHKWAGIPRTAWIQWMGDFTRDGYEAQFPTTFALGVHSIGRGVAYPPSTLTDTMFTPLSQNGDGMQIADFVWQQYKVGFPPTDIYACA